jgi:hypothetical protein
MKTITVYETTKELPDRFIAIDEAELVSKYNEQFDADYVEYRLSDDGELMELYGVVEEDGIELVFHSAIDL